MSFQAYLSHIFVCYNTRVMEKIDHLYVCSKLALVTPLG